MISAKSVASKSLSKVSSCLVLIVHFPLYPTATALPRRPFFALIFKFSATEASRVSLITDMIPCSDDENSIHFSFPVDDFSVAVLKSLSTEIAGLPPEDASRVERKFFTCKGVGSDPRTRNSLANQA